VWPSLRHIQPQIPLFVWFCLPIRLFWVGSLIGWSILSVIMSSGNNDTSVRPQDIAEVFRLGYKLQSVINNRPNNTPWNTKAAVWWKVCFAACSPLLLICMLTVGWTHGQNNSQTFPQFAKSVSRMVNSLGARAGGTLSPSSDDWFTLLRGGSMVQHNELWVVCHLGFSIMTLYRQSDSGTRYRTLLFISRNFSLSRFLWVQEYLPSAIWPIV
jgi:hypothetical protein